MKKVLYTDFVTTESLVEVLLEKKEIKKAITRNNLYKFWEKIAGSKFAKKSKPYSMMGGGVMLKIKKGDTVKVIAGKDKDKEGKVIAVNAKKNTASCKI